MLLALATHSKQQHLGIASLSTLDEMCSMIPHTMIPTCGTGIQSQQYKACTSLGKYVVLLQIDALGWRVLVVQAHEHVSVEEVKLLTAFSGDGSSQSPHYSEQEQALQPHGDLLG